MNTVAKGHIHECVFVDEPSLDLHFVQEEGSTLRLFVVNFHSAENIIHVQHTGADCHTEIYALACLKGNEIVHTCTRMHHDVGGGTSKQLIKFVLDDTSQGAFLGELKIQKGAQQVDAQQTNRNLLLSDKALMRTQPQLEIYADDVKASHGASTGQLDESALFYMQQRGLSYRTARQMLIAAFLKEVLQPMGDESKKEQLLQTIDGVID